MHNWVPHSQTLRRESGVRHVIVDMASVLHPCIGNTARRAFDDAYL